MNEVVTAEQWFDANGSLYVDDKKALALAAWQAGVNYTVAEHKAKLEANFGKNVTEVYNAMVRPAKDDGSADPSFIVLKSPSTITRNEDGSVDCRWLGVLFRGQSFTIEQHFEAPTPYALQTMGLRIPVRYMENLVAEKNRTCSES